MSQKVLLKVLNTESLVSGKEYVKNLITSMGEEWENIYPSKMEFSLFYKGDKLQTKFFSWEGEKLDSKTKIGPFSKVKFIAAWFSLWRGTCGLSLKPKLMQIVYRERENIYDECLLEVEERENADCNLEPVAYNNPDYGFDENDDSI